MSRGRICAILTVATLGFSVGCTPIGPEGASGTLLDLLGGQNITADTTLGDLLNEITVGDLVEGFAQFADQRGVGTPPAALTDADMLDIEALQAEFDQGRLAGDEFGERVHGMMGDRGPRRPFVGFEFFGSPFGHRSHGQRAEPLDLTDEQREAAEEIFRAAHEDISALRTAAHEDILAQLTDEQLGLFEDLRPDGEFRPSGQRGFGHMHMRFPGRDGQRRAATRLEEELELTEEQQSAIETIRAELREAVQARHEEAREEFLDLLSDEQLAILDEMGVEKE
ncbi:MAG: hypothetical protein IID33_15545 [Planctomycetes bacterium]|nr:hypothetical protein [Planctomycetota bacterium]